MVRPACRMLTSAPDNGVPDTLSATVPLMSPSTGGAARRAAAAAGRVKPPAVARHARIVTAFAKCLALMCSPLTSTSSRGPCASGVGTGEATGWRFLGIGAARLARRAVRREREVPWVGGGVGRPLRGTALERRGGGRGAPGSRYATRPGGGGGKARGGRGAGGGAGGGGGGRDAGGGGRRGAAGGG